MNPLEPPPSMVDLVDKSKPDSIWKIWLNNLYEVIKELVADEVQKTAFGEQSVAEPTPVIQADFAYNVNSELWNSNLNGGSASVADHMLVLSTGASAGNSAGLFSRVPVKYKAGLGAFVRFSGIFTTGVIGSSQLIGIGDIADGLAFAYVDDVFGIIKVAYGHSEVQTLTITTGNSTAESVTVTLDGDAVSVPLTDTSANVTITANEIAAHDYSLVGLGWDARAIGDEVVFQSFRATPLTGAFTLAGTTVVGAFVETLAGFSPTVTFVAQADWNGDKMTGLDQTKGNVYQIKYGWLGFNDIEYSIKDEGTGKFVLVHTLRYANKNVLPLINDPTLPLLYFVENSTNTTDIVIKSGSIGGFVEGKLVEDGVIHGVGADRTNPPFPSGEAPIITIHSPILYKGVPNRVSIKLNDINVAVDGNNSVIGRIYRNADLVDASFTNVDADTSTMMVDTSATGLSGGDLLRTFLLDKVAEKTVDLAQKDFKLRPNDFLTITLESTSLTEALAGINVTDLF